MVKIIWVKVCCHSRKYLAKVLDVILSVGFLPRDALLSAVYAVVVCLCVCVCVCVCHTPVLYQNG